MRRVGSRQSRGSTETTAFRLPSLAATSQERRVVEPSRVWTFAVGAELAVQSQHRRTTVHDTHSCSQLKTHLSVPALYSAGCSRGCRVPSSGAVVTVQRVRRRLCSGVTMAWLLRLVTGGSTGGRGPPTVREFLVINFSVCLVLLKLKNGKRHNQELAKS